MFTSAGNIHSAKPGVMGPTSGDGFILWQMLSTAHLFKAASSEVYNLRRHVASRNQIVNNALNADFIFGLDRGFTIIISGVRLAKTNSYVNGDLWRVSYSDSTTPWLTNSFDRLGRVKQVIRNGMTTSYSFNQAGEVLSESYSGGTLGGQSVVNLYDSYLRRSSVQVNGYSGTLNSYTYDTAGRVSSVSDGTNNATYTYLANSPLVSQIDFKNNTTLRMTTAKQYDFLNRLQSIASSPAGTSQLPFTFGYVYNDANQRRKVSTFDGSYWVYGYDFLGQVISGKKHFVNGTPVPGQQFEYGFDDIGNRTTVKMGGDEVGNNLRSVSYTANNLNQYSSRFNSIKIDVLGIASSGATVSINSDSSGVYRKGQYSRKELSVTANTYPSISTVASSGGSSTTVAGYVFVPPATENYTYDDDGNLTVDGRWNYTWDGENRLIQVESKVGFPTGSQRKLTFEYDSIGRRIRLKIYVGSSGTPSTDIKLLYDGWNLVAELDALNSDTVIRSYIWGKDLTGTIQGAGGVGGLLAMRTNNVAYFAAYDGNGNVVGLVDGSTGTVAATYEYDPFGQTIRATGAIGKVNPFRFSTKYTDDETDLLYYGYRYYNPSTGRWISKDPLGEIGGRNLYGFCFNRPIYGIDQYGMGFLEDAANYAAGVGDSLTFGLTRQARKGLNWMLYDEYDDGRVDPTSGAYIAGEVTEVAVEIAVTAGGASLRHTARLALRETLEGGRGAHFAEPTD